MLMVRDLGQAVFFDPEPAWCVCVCMCLYSEINLNSF